MNRDILIQFVFHSSFFSQLFYANVFQEKNKITNMNEGVLKKEKNSVIYCSKLLRKTFLKMPVNEFSFGKITG